MHEVNKKRVIKEPFTSDTGELLVAERYVNIRNSVAFGLIPRAEGSLRYKGCMVWSTPVQLGCG